MGSTLRGADRPLTELFDVALLDLDGVVYVGKDAVPGAPESLAAARQQGMHLAFVTNNAARPPRTVAGHLTELGIAAQPDEVITSSQAAARYLRERLHAGAEVLVLGTTGLYDALEEQGLSATDTAGPDTVAVVQGYSPTMNWQLLAEGTVAVRAGAVWVATNADPTVPSPRGPLPGNGSLVAALRTATGADPVITGKPDPTMHRETLIRTGAERPIVVGDRLDTDIEGANAVGCPSLLVLSGVTDARDLLAAGPRLRPTYLGRDVSALLETHPDVTDVGGRWQCGGWAVEAQDDGLQLARVDDDPPSASGDSRGGPGSRGDGDTVDSALDALRALCAASWSAADSGVSVVRAGDDAATAVLDDLGLATR
ncbi:HAD hydrolase-like protein [Jatrophihabitans fulvus]